MDLRVGEYQTAGQLLSVALREKGWTQRLLSAVLGVDQSTISLILNDKKALDAPLAIAFSEVFGIPAERLLSVQQEYELARARLTMAPDTGRARRAQLLGDLPISEMVSRGWIKVEDVRDTVALEAELVRFFGEELDLPHAAKKSDATGAPTWVQRAWHRRVQRIAGSLQAPRYSPAAVRQAVEKLQDLRASVEGVKKVRDVLTEAGVRFVVVESIGSAKIDGVCSWLNDMTPVIGMTLRHDRIDNFWFVLRHEIEHVLRGHGRRAPVVDLDLASETTKDGAPVAEEERVANDAAADFCVPKEQMDNFIAKKAPYYVERDVLGFAATLRLHPGLVVGQLQHRTRRFDRFRKHLAKVRMVILPEVPADGWGNEFPVDTNTPRVA